MGGRSPNAADLKSIAGSLRAHIAAPAPKREVQRHACHVNALSIFPLDVLLHLSPHLEQPAPSPLEERHHLVDLCIARQLELRLARLCGGRTWYTGYWQPTGQQFLLQRCILALQASDLGLQR